MSRIKNRTVRLTALALCAVLCLCPSISAASSDTGFRPDNEELYFSALTEEIVEEIKTTKVTREDFVVNSSCQGEIEYASVNYCFNTYSGTVEFVKYLVSNGDYVENGDPIAEVKVSQGSIAIDDLKLKIENAEENLESYIDVNNALLMEYTDIIENSSSESERKTAGLLYDRLSFSFEEEKTRREDELADLRNTLSVYEDLQGKQYITAGASGTVSGLNRYRPGNTLGNYAYICGIYDVDHIRIRVGAGNDKLCYGMKVTVLQALDDKSRELQGRVVTSHSALLPAGLIAGNGYIEVEGDPSGFSIGESVTVKFKMIEMENALVLDKEAVYFDNKGDYVFLYVNGAGYKRYITKGGQNGTKIWIVNGLSEGDEVVIK